MCIMYLCTYYIMCIRKCTMDIKASTNVFAIHLVPIIVINIIVLQRTYVRTYVCFKLLFSF